ncbi:MAG TPA: S9 family peptidase [Actinomycetota bacterium]|jgi:dipeptidyl aminopeptidase/acylaminoacyl peptidase
MERDLRETPLYGEVERFFRSVLEPGFGQAWPAGDPVPSPDGAEVAFRGERLDRLEGHPVGRICLVGADGAGLRTITDGPNDDSEPRWSPDGKRLTFRSDRERKGRHGLYVLDRGELGEARALGSFPGSVEWHRWSPDGDRLLVGVAGDAAEQADALGSGTLGGEEEVPPWVPDVESSDLGEAERRAIWLVDAASGDVRRLSPSDRNVWEADWCGPDSIVAVVSDGAGEDAWYGAGVSIFDAASGDERRLFSSDVQLGWVAGSPSGERIAVIEAVCSDRMVICGDLRVVDVATGESTAVDLGDVDASLARWLDDDRLLVFGRRGLDSVVLEFAPGLASVHERWVTSESMGELYHPSGAPLGEGFVVLLSSHARPPSIVAVDADGTERDVAAPRHAGDDVVLAAVGTRSPMRWSAPDGLEIEGLLTTPPGEGPFPLVLSVHGGPIGTSDDGFPGLLHALLLSRGFAILQPNPRGSAGRGQDFAAAVVGDMGGADVGDVLAGVDAAVEAGHADPDRLVLTGGSYGGFMAAWIPTRDRRFKASVAVSPVTDWWSERFDSSLGAWVGDFLGGQPRDVPHAYTDRSPVLAVEDVTTPVLLTAGRHDRATPVGQAVEFYRALRERGVPTEVVVYPQEGHGVGDLPAVLDLATRTVAWFERFLPGGDGGR